MSEEFPNLNPQIQEAVAMTTGGLTSPEVVKAQGEGMAFQSVAQSTAIAIQDATDYLRNVEMIAVATIGVASAKMIEEKTTTPWSDIIQVAQSSVDTAAATFTAIGTDAAQVVNGYPNGQ